MGGHHAEEPWLRAIEMLGKSHRRLEEYLQELVVALTDEASGWRDTVDEVVSYLETSARLHEQDEEESIFPHLPKGVATELARKLATEHRHHEELQNQFFLLWRNEEHDMRQLRTTAESLQQAYSQHISLEEGSVLPHIKRLDRPVLTQAFWEMQARRGKPMESNVATKPPQRKPAKRSKMR